MILRSFVPTVIIGAPRSGTNILRDSLVRLSTFGTWPCDEINPIWRHGNARHDSDELPRELATPHAARYIRRRFQQIANRQQAFYVVEKTCANSLRVDFVDRILPDARFLFIVRNGIDAVASADKRWTAHADLAYTLRKARWVPRSDIPYYGCKFVLNRLYRARSREKRLASWGPRLKGMDILVANHTLVEVCALQWSRCVGAATQAFDRMPAHKVHRLRYEDFVSDPVRCLRDICKFLEVDLDEEAARAAASQVRTESVGRGARELEAGDTEAIAPLIAGMQKRHGYA
jgi:hypothetical protein